MMKKVLITGGAGFIGLHLARRLAAMDCEVVLADNLARGKMDNEAQTLLELPNVSFVQCNLLDRSDAASLGNDFDTVYHLAALLGVQNVLDRPMQVLRDNVIMTANVVDGVSGGSTTPRIIYTSTSEVYAGTLKFGDLPLPTPEETPLIVSDTSKPRTSYMLSKIYGEALCQLGDLPYTVIRPHNVYGPRMGMAHVIPELLKRTHETPAGGSLDVWSVDHTRTFCFVDDAVDMLLAVAQTPACENQVINLGTEKPETTILELAKDVMDVVGKELSINPKPATAGSPTRRCPQMSKMTELTGLTSKVGLREGVEKTYAWYKENVF